jgi:cytochrome b6-f complex iron-sulfur subunit
MAEKKKLSVAEILAAARKADKGEAAAEKPAAAPPAEEAVKSEAAAAPEGGEAPKATPKPAAKPGGARLSVAEMMAAARAQKGGEAAKPAEAKAKPSPPVEKAGAEKAAPKPAAEKAKPAAEKPAEPAPVAAKETSSILAAARTAAKPGPMSKAEAAAKAPAKEGKPKLVAPPMPTKPDYAKPKAPPQPVASEDRRFFLSVFCGSIFGALFGSSLAIGFSSMAATFSLWTLGTARFMFPNVLTEPPSRFKVGFPSEFPPGMVEEKFKAQFGVWVVNTDFQGKREIVALRTVCTHLGCTPNWLEGEQKFKCPCHGSGFYKDGINFEGPAPRPLERYAIQLADDGQLEVDKSKLFQEELGQWNDPACFVPA